jgi:hypothetical protein
MRKTGTGGQTWPLTSPLSAPVFAAGGQVRFDMNDVPAKCPTGPLAYYVPALILTFIGALVNAGESPSSVTLMDLPGLLIQSVEVRDVWHGVPVSSQYWLGEHLRIHEFIGSGYQYAQRISNWITPDASPGADATFQVRIPLSAGEGQLIRETSQLALLYQPGSVNITMKSASVLDGKSSGTTWVGSINCDLELDPRAELVLGTPIEHVLHRQVSAPTDPDIQIKGFGRSSKLTGVEAKGGVLHLMELTATTTGPSGVSLGGVFLGDEVARYSFDWRGQKITSNPRAVLSTLLGQMGHWPDVPVPGNAITVGDAGNASSEQTTFPYEARGANLAVAEPLNANLLAWLMVVSGIDARLTDVQCADSDQTYHLELGGSATYDTGDHLILARYAKVFAEGKRADWISQVKRAGLDTYVLGNGAGNAALRPRAPTDKHTITADQLAFLPYQYV